MFRHVVMVRWAEGVTEEQKQGVRDGLAALPEQVPEIRAFRFGDDAGLGEDNFDFALVADFDNRDGFMTYREHPAHQKFVVDIFRPAISARVAVQHEWPTGLPADLPA